VAGSGKTTVGTLLADMLGWQFADADSFHPAANVRKMADGAALDDQDRLPWLEALKGAIQNWLSDDLLRVDGQRVAFVYLKGDAELFEKRLKERRGHYMKVSMLESQLKTLEEPSAALYVDASNKPDRIASEIISSLDLQ
jgi:gluconokinase